MNCDDARAELTAWLDGELGPDDQSRLTAHLQACIPCQAEERQLRALRRLVDHELQGAPAALAPGSFERVWEQRRVSGLDQARGSGARQGHEASRAARPRGLRWALPAGLAIAASLAILVVRTMPPEQTGRPVKPKADAKESAPAPAAVKKAEPARAPAARKPAEVIAAADPKPATEPAQPAPATNPSRKPSQNALPGGVVALSDAPPMEAEVVSADAIPAELRERPGLFVDYSIVRRLDQLRHLDDLAPEPSRAGSKGTG